MGFFTSIYNQLHGHLDLYPDREDEQVVIENVRKSVEFKGSNLWILMFAILIASIGLNINSIPVIIGAMLISPLMGPITGAGLAIGINDMELMKRSLRNLLVATLFSIFVATVYFLITPLNEAQSELLSRTSPNIYDVFIALVGGAAGFLAISSIGNNISVIIGVACSTALMPPLCTVGYGIATTNWLYAIGALYLFFINSVFIAIATFISVRFLKFNRKQFIDKIHENRVRRSIIAISLLTLCPSIYLTYNIVKETIYNQNAEHFINNELNFAGTRIIYKQISYKLRSIQIALLGDEVQQAVIDNAKSKLSEYNLKNTKLDIIQSGATNNAAMISNLKSDVLKDLYQDKQQELNRLTKINDSIKTELLRYTEFAGLDSAILPEIRILYPQVQSIAMGYSWQIDADGKHLNNLVLAYIQLTEPLDEEQENRLNSWLGKRINSPVIKIFYKSGEKK